LLHVPSHWYVPPHPHGCPTFAAAGRLHVPSHWNRPPHPHGWPKLAAAGRLHVPSHWYVPPHPHAWPRFAGPGWLHVPSHRSVPLQPHAVPVPGAHAAHIRVDGSQRPVAQSAFDAQAMPFARHTPPPPGGFAQRHVPAAFSSAVASAE
jgi:hypothetical protein